MRQRPINKRLAKWLDTFGKRLCPIEECPKRVSVLWRDRRFNNSPIIVKHFSWYQWHIGAVSRMGHHDRQSKVMRDHNNYGKHAG